VYVHKTSTKWWACHGCNKSQTIEGHECSVESRSIHSTAERAAENRAGQDMDVLTDGLIVMVQAFRRARRGRGRRRPVVHEE
jgi:hypothetical protein